MGKSKPSSSSNPWEALFSSATRPHPSVVSSPSIISNNANGVGGVGGDISSSSSTSSTTTSSSASSSAGGYTILLQHSITPKSQRQWALSSATSITATDNSRMRSTTKSSSSSMLSSSMGSMTLNSSAMRGGGGSGVGGGGGGGSGGAFQGSWYGMSGPFLVRQAFEELCERCDGGVVFVSLLGTSGVLDLDELDLDDGGGGGGESNNWKDGDYSGDNGDDDDDEEDREGQRHTNLKAFRKRNNALRKFRRNGAWVDLSSDPFGWDEDTENHNGGNSNSNNNSFVQKSTMEKLQSIAMAIRRAAATIETRRPPLFQGQEQKNQGKKKEQYSTMQTPIPIVFETLTPLLQLHGVEKISLLIKSLGKCIVASSSSSMAVPSGMTNVPILSPIVAPILYESLRPSEHRCLEDIADAMLHLNLMEDHPRGVVSTSSSPFNDHTPNSTPVISGVVDLVRRGGGGGGKLIRHCVPFRIMRAMMSKHSISPLDDARGSCYWVLDRDDYAMSDGGAAEIGKGQPLIIGKSAGSVTTTTSEGQQTSSSTAGPSRPRIYLQDDDPEFDDFDEEDDLDDDLDL